MVLWRAPLSPGYSHFPKGVTVTGRESRSEALPLSPWLGHQIPAAPFPDLRRVFLGEGQHLSLPFLGAMSLLPFCCRAPAES